MTWLGLDIGGANLKLANGLGYADSLPFALWREPDRLPQQLRTMIAQAPPASHLAVTMTGELADCFDSKEDGVRYILDAVQQAADGRHTRVYLLTGQMVTPQVARRRPAEVAAANWHALATFCARMAGDGLSLVMDVGSTTTDIIPLADGKIAAIGYNDTARLLANELIYLGVERTPICGLVRELPYRGQTCPVANELFATTRDAFLILKELPENPASNETADGTAATKARSRLRLSRMICADSSTFNHRDAVTMAHAVAAAASDRILGGLRKVTSNFTGPLQTVIVGGAGEFLARSALKHLATAPAVKSLSRELGVALSRCGPAHALAVLAREAAAR
jgi:probable H4MPT-linked C1 transfer pathway protein